jgi:hypothetical protein
LKQQLQRAQKHKKNLLQHNNTWPHTLQITMVASEKLDLTIFSHLPHSADLVPCDLHHFPLMNEDLCAHRYDSNEDVERSQDWMKTQNVAFFRGGFETLVHHWWKSVCRVVVIMWRSKYK